MRVAENLSIRPSLLPRPAKNRESCWISHAIQIIHAGIKIQDYTAKIRLKVF